MSSVMWHVMMNVLRDLCSFATTETLDEVLLSMHLIVLFRAFVGERSLAYKGFHLLASMGFMDGCPDTWTYISTYISV